MSCVPVKTAATCPPGQKMVDGYCKPISVTVDLDISDFEVVVEATTGQTIVEIKGVAFHEGMNKNDWSLTYAGALQVMEQMKGSDITLNHPDANEYGPGFDRNMEGGVDQAVVGYITDVSMLIVDQGRWEVHYIAHIIRNELFVALESGLWSREDYGVSIGGSGIPISVAEEGIVFGEDFTFDHLAIVHRPAYERASIDEVRRIEGPEADLTFKYRSSSASNHTTEVTTMTEETTQDFADEKAGYESEIESLKADLILSSARVNEFEAAEQDRVESDRQTLVDEASSLGMSGHDDLSADTLTSLIASWTEAHPEPEPVEMKPVEEAIASDEQTVEATTERRVVANFLNGKLVESDEDLYERCWNSWARAWNGTLASDEKSSMRAPMYAEAKEMI